MSRPEQWSRLLSRVAALCVVGLAGTAGPLAAQAETVPWRPGGFNLTNGSSNPTAANPCSLTGGLITATFSDKPPNLIAVAPLPVTSGPDYPGNSPLGPVAQIRMDAAPGAANQQGLRLDFDFGDMVVQNLGLSLYDIDRLNWIDNISFTAGMGTDINNIIPVPINLACGQGTAPNCTTFTISGNGTTTPSIVSTANNPSSFPGYYAARARVDITIPSQIRFLRIDYDPDPTGSLTVSQRISISRLVFDCPDPTAAWITSFRRLDGRHGPVIEWQTGAEAGSASFELYRVDPASGDSRALSRKPVAAALAHPQGATYRLRVPEAGPDDRFVLVEHEIGGHTRLFGPLVPRPGALPEKGLRMSGLVSVVPHRASATYLDRLARSRDASRAPPASAAIPLESVRAGTASGSRFLEVAVEDAGILFVPATEIALALQRPVAWARRSVLEGSLDMRNRGQQVAWQGAEDGSGLFFFGEGIDSPYTRANIYQILPGTGRLMESADGGSPPAGEPGETRARLRFEQDVSPVTVIARDPDSDYWYWGLVLGHESLDLSLETPGATEGEEAHATVYLQGLTAGPHKAQVRINGVVVGSASWSGVTAFRQVLSLPASLLDGADNAVRISGTGGVGSQFAVDALEIEYPRRLLAQGDVLSFTAATDAEVTVGGFRDPAVTVYDVSRPRAPRRVVGTTLSGQGDDYRVTFGARSGARYVAASSSAIPQPTLRARRSSPLPALRDRYVVIAPSSLLAAARSLAAYRSDLGGRAVALEDIYDLYNEGIPSPHAIQRFVRSERPAWVVLAGAGSLDYRDLLGFGGNLVPPALVPSRGGLVASDLWYGELGGRRGARTVPVGRIPVFTGDELLAYLRKLRYAERSGGGGEIALVSDNADGGGDFDRSNDVLARGLPAWLSIRRISLTGSSVTETRQALLDAFNRGDRLINYFGHGGLTQLATEGLLRVRDVPLLTNRDRPTVLTAFTCNIARFEVPGLESLAASLVASGSGGAVAVVAPSGLTLNGPSLELARRFYSNLRRGDRLGKALVLSLAAGVDPDTSRVFNLLGDPALDTR